MNRVYVFLLLGISMLAGALIGAPQANAQSVYDDTIRNVTFPITPKVNGTPSYYTFNNSFEIGQYLGTLTSSDVTNMNSGTCAYNSSLQNSMVFQAIQGIKEGKPYLITYDYNENTPHSYINFYVNLGTTPTTSWEWINNSSSGRYLYLNSSTNFVNFTMGAKNDRMINLCFQSESTNALAGSSGMPDKKFVETNQPITYPEGYSGPNANVIAPAREQSDWTPDWYVSVSTDWKASIHDQNFNTFDEVPFTCSEVLAPVLNYEIWDRNSEPNVMLHSGTQSATAQIDYQFEKKPTNSDYRIVGWYDCGPEPEIGFSDSSFSDFTINGTGGLHTLGLETCMVDGFPYFNLESCTVGLNETLALLTFQMANPTNEGVLGTATTANPNSCYNMGTLGRWINRENQPVCPAFSSEVRGVVTPFIIVVLASGVFYFISRGRGVVI